MNLLEQYQFDKVQHLTRRHFLSNCSLSLGAMWMAAQQSSLFGKSPQISDIEKNIPHFAPKAKRVIYLHMAGSPSQLELFDHKSELTKNNGKECPMSFLEGKNYPFIAGVPKLLGSVYPFHQHKRTGQWVSDRFPHFEEVMDEVCIIKSMYSDQFNHGPAQLLLHTGSQLNGSPSMGAWTTYGLGSENENLPGFIVLTSGANPSAGKSVWGSGYLPSVYQGVQCRSQGDPVLYLKNPDGVSRSVRRQTIDALNDLNNGIYREVGDAETQTRIAQYEMAFRMQASATDAFDMMKEKPEVHEAYGTKPGEESFANNCLLARRLTERGVRYIQLFDWGWDSHGENAANDLRIGFADKCRQIDKPIAALLKDLKQRGLLDETLVIWSGEFGRTSMQENRFGGAGGYGRDHSPTAFSLWMAGGGVKPGISYGETDEIGLEAVRDKVSSHDLHATVMQLLGFNHKLLTYPFQGLEQRLSNVTKESHIIKDILS